MKYSIGDNVEIYVFFRNWSGHQSSGWFSYQINRHYTIVKIIGDEYIVNKGGHHIPFKENYIRLIGEKKEFIK